MSDQGRTAIRRWLLMVDQGCLAIRPLWKLKLSRHCKVWALGLGLHQATEEFCSLIKPLRGFAFLKLSQRFQVWSSVKVLVSHVRFIATPSTVLARLLWPWSSPGKNTGVGIHSFLQGILPTQGWNLHLLHCRWILYHLSHQGSGHLWDLLNDHSLF